MIHKEKYNLDWLTFFLFFSLYLGLFITGTFFLSNFIAFLAYISELDWSFLVNGYYVLMIDAVIFFVIFASFKKVRQFTIRAFDFSVMRLAKTYGYMLVCIILFFIVQTVLIGILNVDDSSGQKSDLGFDAVLGAAHRNPLEIFLLYLSIAILTPIKEEIIYRGIIHRFLEHRYNFWIGLIGSSLVFGLLHFGFPISAVAMGILFVVLYRLTGSLIPPITLHMAWNSLVSIAVIYTS